MPSGDNGQAVGRAAAEAAHRIEPFAFRRHPAHAAADGIGDVDRARAIDGDPGRLCRMIEGVKGNFGLCRRIDHPHPIRIRFERIQPIPGSSDPPDDLIRRTLPHRLIARPDRRQIGAEGHTVHASPASRLGAQRWPPPVRPPRSAGRDHRAAARIDQRRPAADPRSPRRSAADCARTVVRLVYRKRQQLEHGPTAFPAPDAAPRPPRPSGRTTSAHGLSLGAAAQGQASLGNHHPSAISRAHSKLLVHQRDVRRRPGVSGGLFRLNGRCYSSSSSIEKNASQ